MKKVIIGSIMLFSGVLQNIGLFICAAIYLPNLKAWSTAYPSKLWFLILAGKSRFDDGADGLGLGLFFALGILMMGFGIWTLISEYIKKEKG